MSYCHWSSVSFSNLLIVFCQLFQLHLILSGLYLFTLFLGANESCVGALMSLLVSAEFPFVFHPLLFFYHSAFPHLFSFAPVSWHSFTALSYSFLNYHLNLWPHAAPEELSKGETWWVPVIILGVVQQNWKSMLWILLNTRDGHLKMVKYKTTKILQKNKLRILCNLLNRFDYSMKLLLLL